MSRLGDVLGQAARELEDSGLGWAVVGGLAVSSRCEPRFTRDVDVAVAVADDSEAEALVARFVASGYQVLATLDQSAAGRLAAVRLLAPGEQAGGIVLDLLLASSGLEPELVEAAEPVEVLPGRTAPVARVEHLIALKVLADSPQRPQDRADLARLVAVATDEEIEKARSALQLIQSRQFGRDKDLVTELDARLTELGRA